MAAYRETRQCPECQYEGYSYDPVCKLWCCGRCCASETDEEMERRVGAQSRVLEGAAGAPRARRLGQRALPADRLPIRARYAS